MSGFRFKVGTLVMCNLGPDGWKLGRVIALHYREMDWPTNMVAPYQVVLEADQMLIYVPEDDARYCRRGDSRGFEDFSPYGCARSVPRSV